MSAHGEVAASDIHAWFSPHDSSLDTFERAVAERLPVSGQWLLQSAEYSRWKEERNSFLWIHGGAGNGKTVLSATIVEDLMRSTVNAERLLFYFFTFKDSQQSFDNMMRSLTWQLYQKHEIGRKHVDLLYYSCENGRREPSIASLCSTFQDMAKDAGEIWMVLDALDECSTRRIYPSTGLLPWMKSISQSEDSNIHTLTTSRQEDDVNAELTEWVHAEAIISVEERRDPKELHKYVEWKLTKSRKHGGLISEDLARIKTTLAKRSQGMFLWAKLVLDQLDSSDNVNQQLKTLDSIPSSLDNLYVQLLSKIPKSHEDQTIRLFQLLAFCTIPLRADEAIDAIAVKVDGNPQFDPQNRVSSARELIKYCSGLVELVPSDNRVQGRNFPVTEIRLVHFSVKEFLTSSSARHMFADHFEETSGKASVAKTCLAYLLQLQRRFSAQELDKDLPLSRYASRVWMNLACGAESDDLVHTLISDLFMQSFPYRNWLHLYNPDRPWHTSNPSDLDNVPSPLYYACLGDLRRSVRELLLRKDSDMNRKEGLFGSAIQAAAQAGNEEIVRMLLQQDCQVNELGGLYGTAVQAASQGGHYDIVDLLLNAGANPNLQGGIYVVPPQAAAQRGHLRIVELLLRNGAEINTTDDGFYGSAIQAAAQGGSFAIVDLLINHGAHVDASSGVLGNALQAAAFRGDERIINKLLENGADVNQKGGTYSTALQAAANGGHENIVRTLVDRGADVHAIGGLFGTALQAAAQGGHGGVVTILLDAKADLDAQGGIYGNPITAASESSHEKITQTLIKHNEAIKGNSAIWSKPGHSSSTYPGSELTGLSRLESTTLCQHCRTFDFAAMFADVRRGFLNLGVIQEISSRTRYSLCCVATSVLNNYNFSQKNTSGGDSAEGSICKLYPHPNKPLLSIVCGAALRGHISIIQRCDKGFGGSANYGQSMASKSFDFRFDRVQKPLKLFGGANSELNVNQVRSWLNVCEMEHKDCNEAFRCLESYSPFRLLLIDVRDFCLVDADSRCKYVALSYVRGGADMSETTCKNKRHRKQSQALSEDRLIERGDTLPQIVKDAMDFTRRIGQKFLWVDALCIVQDGEDKTEQIMRMDAIYSQAWLTLASVSGASAYEGLPGISKNCRSPPRTCRTINELDIYLRGRDYVTGTDVTQMHTSHLHLMTEPPGLDIQVDTLPYETRAWTFQERLLSKKCVYLTKHQANFHCRSACVSEIEDAIGIPENSSHTFDHIFRKEYEATSATLSELRGQFLNKSRFLQYVSLVEQYSRRQMAYTDDILNAFSGLSAVLRHNWATKFTCGIPSSFFHEGFLWFPSSANFSRRSTSKQAFPTWSWAGWQGGVQYFSADPRYSSRVRDPVAFSINSQLSVGPDDFSADDFLHGGDPDQASSILNQPNAAVRLHFTTSAVPARCFELIDSGQNMQILDHEGRFCGIIPFMTSQMVAKLKGNLDPCKDPLILCEFVEISRLEPQFERADIQASSKTMIEAFGHTEFEAIAGNETIECFTYPLGYSQALCRTHRFGIAARAGVG